MLLYVVCLCCWAATYLVLKDFEEASGVYTEGGRLEDILFLFALMSSKIKVWYADSTMRHSWNLQTRSTVKLTELRLSPARDDLLTDSGKLSSRQYNDTFMHARRVLRYPFVA